MYLIAEKRNIKGDELPTGMLRGIIMTCIYIVPFMLSLTIYHRFLPQAFAAHFKAIMASSSAPDIINNGYERLAEVLYG